MPRGEQIERHWNLLKTLQTRGEGIPLRDLADQFEVSERTIQRDFEILQEFGFPVDHQDDDFGKRYWRMPHDFFRTGPLVLSLTEAVSLHLAERMFAPLAGTPFADGLAAALTKIRASVPRQALDYFAELEETLHVRRAGVTDYAPQADTIRTLTDAARNRRTVEITYKALWRGAAYTTRFDPYGMVYYDGDLFAIGESHRANDLRIFKVIRITAAVVADKTFDRPEDFDLEAHFRDSFGITQTQGEPIEIQVRFTGPVAGLVEERVWHASQQVQWLTGEETLFEPSGSGQEALLATFRLANTVEFKRWLKGFGDRAEVDRPEWLRRELHDELTVAARMYSPPGVSS